MAKFLKSERIVRIDPKSYNTRKSGRVKMNIFIPAKKERIELN